MKKLETTQRIGICMKTQDSYTFTINMNIYKDTIFHVTYQSKLEGVSGCLTSSLQGLNTTQKYLTLVSLKDSMQSTVPVYDAIKNCHTIKYNIFVVLIPKPSSWPKKVGDWHFCCHKTSPEIVFCSFLINIPPIFSVSLNQSRRKKMCLVLIDHINAFMKRNMFKNG